MSTETIALDYTPGRARPLPRCGGQSISVGAIEDARGVNPRLVMPKLKLGGGLPEGAYVCERPVARICQDALGSGLAAAGCGTGKADLVLSGRLLSLEYAVMMGFSRCMLKAALTMELALTRGNDGPEVWRGTVTGNGNAGVGALVKDTFSGAMDDLVANLLNNAGLVRTG
ncbi:MAG: hypothetical protein ACLFOY_06155 [Desulfatibacillaceae bacterium]